MSFTCPICLTDEGGLIGMLKPCKHRFHKECIRRWHLYAHDLQCPICRVESTHLLVNYTDDQKTAVCIDLKKGFDARNVIDYQQQEERFLRRFNDALRLDSPLSGRERLILTQCNICGEAGSQLDKACHSCGTLFHESCLRSLACEVGDPTSWQQCVQCQDTVNHFRACVLPPQAIEEFSPERVVDPSSLHDPIRLKEAKRKIQSHVRRELDKFYHRSNNGTNGGISSLNKLDKRHFTDINKLVSRKLYRVSNYRYQEGILDYDLEAQKEVRLELRKLGYTDV